jgi:TonB family protein
VGGGQDAKEPPAEVSGTVSPHLLRDDFGRLVVLAAIIGSDGRPVDLRVVRSLGMGLDQKALEAVRHWKFEPALKDGKPVTAQVNLEIAFANGISKTIAMTGGDGSTKSVPPAPPRRIDTKLHPRLVAAYDCWRAQPGKTKAISACNIESDKLLVRVILSQYSATAFQELKAIGFEALSAQPRPKQLIGRIGVERLASLAGSSIVQFVAPASVTWR